jgi:hypothetical protein
VAGRDAEPGCHPEHGLGPDHLVQCFSTDWTVAAVSLRWRSLRQTRAGSIQLGRQS